MSPLLQGKQHGISYYFSVIFHVLMALRGHLVHCTGSEDPVPMVFEFLEQLQRGTVNVDTAHYLMRSYSLPLGMDIESFNYYRAFNRVFI